MTYVDGFLIPVPKAKLAAYRKFARLGRKMWMEHGALDYKECVADELFSQVPGPDGKLHRTASQFPKMARAKRGEVVIFSYIVFASKAARDRINRKVMADPRMAGIEPSEMPVDGKRFGYAGFKVLVDGKA
jgi:uncharacterized protein YbaA (DUF1428 family)